MAKPWAFGIEVRTSSERAGNDAKVLEIPRQTRIKRVTLCSKSMRVLHESTPREAWRDSPLIVEPAVLLLEATTLLYELHLDE
jgi:hypothetical protein